MAFEDLAAFLHMRGHWPYVWSAYGVTLLVLLGNLLYPLLERRLFLADEMRRHRRQQRRGHAESGSKPSDT